MAESSGMEDDLAELDVEQLRRRARSLEAQLSDAMGMAEAERIARDDFMSDLGHEIRTPMNAVIGFCDLLYSTRMDAVSKGYVESIRTAGIKLLDIFTERSDALRNDGQPRTGPIETCFVPRSKVFPPEGTEEGQELETSPGRFGGARILVVDDSEVNRLLVRGILERAGIEVLEASDGGIGVEKALSEGPDLILMDMRMSKMDGPEAARALRLDPRTTAIPILALTASVEIPSASQGPWPFDSYMRKPIDIPLLMKALNRFLSARRSEGAGSTGLEEPRPGQLARDALRTAVEGAWTQMGGDAIRFSVVRTLVVEIELLRPDPAVVPEVAAFARALRAAADSRDVVVLERLLLSVLEDPK